jgi:ATP-dependent Clp protease ATP-binding subunit ClpX
MLISVLTEPKNSLVKQFTQVMALDGVELVIEREALEAIADQAVERQTGARGLRSILERVLLEPMYDVPGRSDVSRCIVTADAVRGLSAPVYELRKSSRTRRAS